MTKSEMPYVQNTTSREMAAMLPAFFALSTLLSLFALPAGRMMRHIAARISMTPIHEGAGWARRSQLRRTGIMRAALAAAVVRATPLMRVLQAITMKPSMKSTPCRIENIRVLVPGM